MDQPDLTRLGAAYALCLIYVLGVGARVVLNRIIPGPEIFIDELVYVETARSLAVGGGVMFAGLPTNFPCWLYSLMIAPVIAHWPMSEAHSIIRVLNVFVMGSTSFFAYGLARELASRRRAVSAALLVTLMHNLAYSAYVMTESLFLPIFTLAIWMAVRAMIRPSAIGRIAAGLAFGLAFHVKPQGLILAPIFALAVGAFELERLRYSASPSRIFVPLARSLARHWLTVFAWLIGLSPRMFEILVFEDLPDPFSTAAFFGTYGVIADGFHEFRPDFLWPAVFGLAAVWIVGTGFFPAIGIFRSLLGRGRSEQGSAARALVIFLSISVAVMIAMFARHTALVDAAWRVHERYLMVLMPALLAWFCACDVSNARPGGSGSKSGTLFAFIVSALAVVMVVIVARHARYMLPDSLTCAGIHVLFPGRPGLRPFTGAFVFLIAAAGASALGSLRSHRGRFLTVALTLILFNYGWYTVNARVISRAGRQVALQGARLAEAIPPQHHLLILQDSVAASIAYQVAFRRPVRFVYRDPKAWEWYATELLIDKKGRPITTFPKRETWLLSAPGLLVNKLPDKIVSGYAFYRLGGRKPLRFLPADAAELPDELAGPAELRNSLAINIAIERMPEQWRAGEIRKVRLRVRNDSGAPLSMKGVRYAIGYHWRDPDRLGDWRPVVWDDGLYGYLPPGLAPDQSAEVSIEVMAPETASRTWRLGFDPIAMRDDLRIWAGKPYAIGVKVEVEP